MKYTTAAVVMKVTNDVKAAPMVKKVLEFPGQMAKPSPSAWTPPVAATIGFTMFVVKAATSAVKSVPTTAAMDRSITLPRDEVLESFEHGSSARVPAGWSNR